MSAPKVTVTCRCGQSVEHDQDCPSVPRLLTRGVSGGSPDQLARDRTDTQAREDAAIIETALQRVAHDPAWIADEGEPAMDALHRLAARIAAVEQDLQDGAENGETEAIRAWCRLVLARASLAASRPATSEKTPGVTVDAQAARLPHEPDYIERTIATVRNHRDADNCWPQWANIFADQIEALMAERAALAARLEAAETALRDDGHDFGDDAIEDLIRVYLASADGIEGAASCTVVDEARKAGRDARAAKRARAALAAGRGDGE